MEPRDDGFRVPVAPVATRASRRWLLAAGGATLAVAAAIAVAQGAPVPVPEPSFSAVVPRPPTTTAPVDRAIATPLPAQEWFTGPEAPMDSVLLDGEAVRWLHIASARSTEPVEGVPGRDLLLRTRADGTLCLCVRPADPDGEGAGTVESIRVDADLNESSRAVLRELPVDRSAGPASRTLVSIEPAHDGRTALLAWLIPSRTAWSIGLDTIDLAASEIVESADLSIRPPRASYFLPAVSAPTLQIAPDGRHAFVAVGAPSGTPEGYGSFAGAAWIVELDGARIGRSTRLDLAPDLRLDRCSWIDFVSAGVVAAACHDPSTGATDDVAVHRWGADGLALADGPLGLDGIDLGQPLIDQADGIVYAWDPVGHRLDAVDLVRGGRRSIEVPERDVPTGVVRLRTRPPASAVADATIRWSDGGPGIAHPTKRTLVGSPDGRWLYAVGRTPDGAGSTGIWAFDADSLQPIERWPALASYDEVGLLEGGRWLMAIGRPGVTAAGGRAAWGVSLTVHDVRSGRPIRRIGDLSLGEPVAIHRDGPIAAAPTP